MNMEKINVAELLKDCPKGMELDCILFDNNVKVIFDGVDGVNTCTPIIKIVVIHNNNRIPHALTKYGQWNPCEYAKCVIFPKGKTSWEGFKKPFVNGDIVTCECNPNKEKQIFIFKEYMTSGKALCHAILDIDGALDINESEYYVKDYATEQEKEKLFEALAQVGCKWNETEKKIENMPNYEEDVMAWRELIKIKSYPNNVFTSNYMGFGK